MSTVLKKFAVNKMVFFFYSGGFAIDICGFTCNSNFCFFARAHKVQEDEDKEGTQNLQRVTVILELLQNKINIEEPHRLLPTLFATLLRYMYTMHGRIASAKKVECFFFFFFFLLFPQTQAVHTLYIVSFFTQCVQ